MRTTFYLAIIIAALFTSSFEAHHLRKRVGDDVMGGLLSGAGGGPLESLAGVTGGVVGAISQQPQLQKKKRGLLGRASEGSNKVLTKGYIVKSDDRSKMARDRKQIKQVNEILSKVIGNGLVSDVIIALLKLKQLGKLPDALGNVKPDGVFKITKDDRAMIKQLRKLLSKVLGNGPLLDTIITSVKLILSGRLHGNPAIGKPVTALLDAGDGGRRSPALN